MKRKIDELFLLLQNNNQSERISLRELNELEKETKNENSFSNYLKKQNKRDFKNLVCKLLNHVGIDTYLTKIGDVNLRMNALGKDQFMFVSFEISNLLDLDSIRDTMENIAILSSRYDTKLDRIKAAIVTKKLPNKRSDVWEMLKNVKSELNLDIYIIPIYALCKISIKGIAFDLDKFSSISKKKSYRISLEKIIQEKINLSKNSSLIESSK